MSDSDSQTIVVQGQTCTVKRFFDDGVRACVTFEGLYCFADKDSDEKWNLSGEPARPGEEKDYYDSLVAPLDGTTTVTVIKE